MEYTYLHDNARFRNSEGNISKNVITTCLFGMLFIYVLASWEGSRPDALVLNSMLSIMNDKLNIPLKVCFDKIIFMYNELCFTLLIFFFIGIYYVVDARYANLPHI